MVVPRAASAAAWTAVNGGATTMSTPAVAFTRSRKLVTNATVSLTVLNIFQLPAIRGMRIKYPAGWMGRRGGLSRLVCERGYARQRLSAEELERRAAAGRDVRDPVGDACLLH